MKGQGEGSTRHAPSVLIPAALADQRAATTHDRGHVRQDEVRTLVAYLGRPGLAQVFGLERTRREHGVAKRALRYGITSLTPEAGTPERLLALKRDHWGIENGLHRVKDLALGEDQSRLTTGPRRHRIAAVRSCAA